MKCPVCDQEIKDSSKFCSKCGKEIPRCPGCGKVIYRRTRFCTYDGTLLPESVLALLPDDSKRVEISLAENTVMEETTVPLEISMQPLKKNNNTVLICAAAAVLVLIIAFGFLGFAVMHGNLASVLSKFGWKDTGSQLEEENTEGLLAQEDEKESIQMEDRRVESSDRISDEFDEESVGEMTSRNGDTTESRQDDALKDYSDIDINAVDNLNVEVTGVVKNKKQQCILKLKNKASVCAYDLNNNVVLADDVKKLIFSNGSGMEDYDGAEVIVTAGLSADVYGQFILDVSGVTVTKEAPDGENAYLDHTYELIMGDVTWQEAFDDCIRRGGYLVRINSEQEFQYIIDRIEEEGMQNIHFYLGGRRAENDEYYYWINENGKFVEGPLNRIKGRWTADHWMRNEPSFSAGDDKEMYMNLIYYQDHWVLNDVPLDITKYYAGKTAYICEYNE